MYQTYIYLYLATLPIFLILDFIWIGLIARSFYVEQLGYLMRTPILWGVAFSFYALFLIGLLYFAVIPALTDGTVVKAAINGALFGFFAYAAYDLTNQATIKDWPAIVTMVDMTWGAVLCGAVAAASFVIGKNIFNL